MRKLYAAAGERMRKIFGGARRKFESSHQILKKGLQLGAKCGILNKQFLGMAQIGSALPWGGRGRGFKSRYSDQKPGSIEPGFFAVLGYLSKEKRLLAILPFP